MTTAKPLKFILCENLMEFIDGKSVQSIIDFLEPIKEGAIFGYYSGYYDEDDILEIYRMETPEQMRERLKKQREQEEAIQKEHRRQEYLKLKEEFED